MFWPQRGTRGCGGTLRAHCGLCLAYRCRRRSRVVPMPSLARGVADAERYGDLSARTSAPRSSTSTASRSSKSGHRDFARQTFEQVIARYPTASAAADARRQLGELYRTDASDDASPSHDGRPALAVAPPATTGSITAPTLSDEPCVARAAAGARPIWDRGAAPQRVDPIEAAHRGRRSRLLRPGSAELGSRARSALAAQAQWLMRWHEFEAAIEGHADEPGTEQENVVLSEQRAEAVRQRLIEEGVEPSRLAVVPLGRSMRVATCADTDCRAQNRRAVTLGVRHRHARAPGPRGQPRAARRRGACRCPCGICAGEDGRSRRPRGRVALTRSAGDVG